jgi:3-hydroxyisobutyrate dehydrogenase
MIAFLGTGLLGAGFVRALRRRGEDVQVWNRSADKANALTETGAVPKATPAQAVHGAERIHIAVSDDAAVDNVLQQAAAGLAPGTRIIDHTTTLPVTTAARVRQWNERGFPFQHAPVFMGPKNALEGTGSMLASGPRAHFDAVAPALERMTGKLVYLGEDAARAASVKLLGNLFLIAMTAGLADMLVLAQALGVPETEATGMFDYFNAAGQIPSRAARMLHGDLSDPSWTLSMARKDTRLMLESAAMNGAELMVMPAIAARMDRSIAAGNGAQDWMIIGRE